MSLGKNDIKKLMEVFEACGWDEMSLETGDSQLVLRRSSVGSAPDIAFRDRAPAPSGGRGDGGSASRAKVEPEQWAPVPVKDEEALYIRAPNLGTFWRQSKPGAPPYVEVGDAVNEETTVCLIEVMKLFTPVKANLKGRIVEVLAENGDMVEYGTPLFKIEPVD